MRQYLRTFCTRFGRAWTAFWFTPSDPIVLSLVRVLVALVAIWWYLGYYADLQTWFGPDGLISPEFTRLLRTDELQVERFAFSIFDYVQGASNLWFVYGLGLVALVMMLAGIFTRLATIVSLVFVLSLVHRGPILTRPADDILPMLLFYLCIGPSGAYFSVDHCFRRRRQSEGSDFAAAQGKALALSSAATLATRLIQVHLALIYAAMALGQLQTETWWQGTAVWWIMARPDSRLVDLTALSRIGLAFEYFVNFFTHAIVLYEICFAILIWKPLARPILLVLGLFIWTGLALITGSVSFALLMIIANLAFLSPETLRRWCAKRGWVCAPT